MIFKYHILQHIGDTQDCLATYFCQVERGHKEEITPYRAEVLYRMFDEEIDAIYNEYADILPDCMDTQDLVTEIWTILACELADEYYMFKEEMA